MDFPPPRKAGRQKKADNKATSKKSPIPPCVVCNDKSSGFHYGANTCEACKAFYRRTLHKKDVKFPCTCNPEEKEAWKRGPVGTFCSSCRYERCLVVGMSRNAIKFGRYTGEHMSKNILALDIAVKSDQLTTWHREAKSVTRSVASSAEKPKSSSTVDIELLKEFDKLAKILAAAHVSLQPMLGAFQPEAVKLQQARHLESRSVKEEVFGKMKKMTKEDYIQFYETTGMDLDGRVQQANTIFSFFQERIKNVVRFAKAIPYFQYLCLEDQASLVKASRTESTLLGEFQLTLRLVDEERGIITAPWGEHYLSEEAGDYISNNDLLWRRLKFARRIAQLNLSTQELSVVRAMVVFFADRCDLKEPEKVNCIQEKLIFCLEHLISLRPGGAKNLLARIMNLVTDLRELTDIEMEVAQNLMVYEPFMSAYPDLVKEFISENS